MTGVRDDVTTTRKPVRRKPAARTKPAAPAPTGTESTEPSTTTPEPKSVSAKSAATKSAATKSAPTKSAPTKSAPASTAPASTAPKTTASAKTALKTTASAKTAPKTTASSKSMPPVKTRSAAVTRRVRWPAVVLLVLALAMVALGSVFLLRAQHDSTSGARANDALVDQARTAQVSAQVSTALNQVLSYDYTKPQLAQQAATRWLTGKAPEQYKQLFAQLRKVSSGQNLTMTARVSKVAVSSLTGDTARLLVFLDQSSRRASDGASSVAAAQVRIVAVHNSAGWRISELTPL